MHTIGVYEDATQTANRFDDEQKSMTGAIYSSDGQIIRQSVRSVDRLQAHLPGDPEGVPRHSLVVGKHNYDGYDMYLEEAVFGGHIYAGWGHNITETISTAWAASEIDPDIPLVLVPWGRLWISALPRIHEVIRLAGWNNRPLILASGSAIYGRVHIPERLIRFDELLHGDGDIPKEMNETYDLMIDRITPPSVEAKRLPTFLARSRRHRRLHPHEVAIETALAADGFRIVEGWDLSVEDQIAVIKSSSALVAFSGSSLHNSVFADRHVPVIEIMDARATTNRPDVKPLQFSLCKLREQPFSEVPGYEEEQVRAVDVILREIAGILRSSV